MLGRTYAQGYEPDLEDALIARPRGRIFDPELCWVVWYPLRRAGSFERLTGRRAADHPAGAWRHRPRLRQGRAGPRHPPGLLRPGQERQRFRDRPAWGRNSIPLSAIVQRMRKTKQTSLHIEHMGPFFVGKAAWQGK